MTVCSTGKISYSNAADAWAVIKMQGSARWRKTHKNPAVQGGHAYLCPRCHGWHVSSPRKVHKTPERAQADRKALRRLSLNQLLQGDSAHG